MSRAMLAILGLLLGAGAYIAVRARKEGSVEAALSATASDIATGVTDVFYALNPDTRANEEKYATAIAAAEARHGLPEGLLHRQLYQESHFRTDIIAGDTKSPAGAIGIAQIIPRWHPGVNPYDPYASIDYAAQFMRRLYNRFGSWASALAAYNWGEGNVNKVLREHGSLRVDVLPTETRNYVAQITSDVGVA